MATVWFTSDLHIGHKLVSAHRGFLLPNGDADTRAHDHAIFSNWSSCVGEEDEIWVLGDLAVTGDRARVEALVWTIAGLPGVKHLIPGNHDPAHPLHRDSHTWQRLYLNAFESVQPFARRTMAFHGGQPEPVLLSHFPYEADSREGMSRYQEYRLRDKGLKLIHGHTHSASKMTSPREVHVGLDAWGLRPVPLDDVINQFETYGRGRKNRS